MPLNCPHCQIAQAEENKTCINCGQPLTPPRAAPAAPFADPALLAEADAAAHLADHDNPVAPDPVHAVQARRASWQTPALIAVGLLLALVASALFVAQRKTAARAALPIPAVTAQPAPGDAPPPPPSAPAPPAAPVPAAVFGTKTAVGAPPLTVTLASTSEGRHVKIGTAVTLTAFTTLAHGQSATLTLFSRRGRGQKTMFSFAQGSLCSTTWTPSVPGRYEFTATALGDRRQAAASRRVEIIVDKPAPQTVAQDKAQDKVAQVPLPVSAAPPPSRLVSLPPPRTVTPRTALRARPPAPPLAYHVAAAQFSFSRSAVVLADALSRRGYQAVPERMADPHGKTVYVVVTGSYRRPKEARKAVLALQRSGYPAYFFGGR